MKKIFKNSKILVSSLTILALVVPFTLLSTVEKAEATNDSTITGLNMASTTYSKIAGATTTYKVTFTVGTGKTLSINTGIRMQFQGQGCPNGVDWMQCQYNFDNATATSSNFTLTNSWGGGDSVSFSSAAALTAGNYTVTFTGVKNPAVIGGLFRVYAMTQVEGQEPPGEGEEPIMTPCNTAIYLGDIAIKGKITKSDGTTPVANAGVEVRTDNFSFHARSNTDILGEYAIADVPNGTYMMEVHTPWDSSGLISPDPLQFTYLGSVLTKNRSFITASKTIKGTVKYGNGNPVTVGEVYANKQGGGSGVSAQLNSAGSFQMLVAGGDWDLWLNSGWDQENQRNNVVDWVYNGQGKFASFSTDSSTEIRTVNFEVEKTDATVTGKLTLPDGSAVAGGHIELRTGDGPGYNSNVDNQTGQFTIPCKAGTYKLNINLDTWNDPTLSKYFFGETQVTVASGQNKNLGTIQASEKTSSISGKIVDQNGVGVAEMRVSTWRRNGEGWSDTVTDSSGKFKLWVFAGDWEVNPEKGGNSNYIYSGPPVMYSVSNNQHQTGANFEVQLADARLNITLIDATTGDGISNMFGYAYARQEEM
ncbi:carboxypeptidase-like regulatory domain-containing protein, partial [Patescibacteria group bacterium]|nr:carboxypeptidase-like regulatory domain-containing protein [Patescibacteria group bacterium]